MGTRDGIRQAPFTTYEPSCQFYSILTNFVNDSSKVSVYSDNLSPNTVRTYSTLLSTFHVPMLGSGDTLKGECDNHYCISLMVISNREADILDKGMNVE